MTTTVGRFISFEGTEGVGKTTAIEGLCQRLQAAGIDYLRTREPGGSPFAERLRAILLDPATDINDDTELLLLFAARADHLQQVILPALQRGAWVICDRFTDSTIAYQGYGRADGDQDGARAERGFQRQRGRREEAHGEQVEDFHHDERVDRHGARLFQAGAAPQNIHPPAPSGLSLANPQTLSWQG